MHRHRNKKLFVLAYVSGVIVGSVFHLLKLIRLIEVQHEDRLPRRQKSLLVLPNHPSLKEPAFAPPLFMKEWIFSQVEWGPWSTPDRNNLRKVFWFMWIGGSRNLPMARKRLKGERREALAREMRASRRRLHVVLRSGGRVVYFTEGGRTTSVPVEKRIRTPKGKELRPLRPSLGDLVVATGASVLPIWFEYPTSGWVWIRIKIGKLIPFDLTMTGSDIKNVVQESLLALADEGED